MEKWNATELQTQFDTNRGNVNILVSGRLEKSVTIALSDGDVHDH